LSAQVLPIEPPISVDALICEECRGTGIVAHRSEFSFFEDRQICAHCEAGLKLWSRIAAVISRASIEDRGWR
jgi:hypothetical protein